jgi:hypothetical protein
MESSTTDDDRALKSERLPVPRTAEGLVTLLKRLITLPNTQSILIEATEVTVERRVAEGEDVVPKPGEDMTPDVLFLLTLLERKQGLLELPFQPDRHPYLALFEATQLIASRDFRPTHLVAPDASWLEAFLGLDEGRAPQTVYGMRVHYAGEANLEERILVVGGSSSFFSDSEIGIAIPLVV